MCLANRDRYITQRLPMRGSYTCVLLGLSTLVSPSSPTVEDVHCTAVNPYSPVAFRTIKVVSVSGLSWKTFSKIVRIKGAGAMLQAEYMDDVFVSGRQVVVYSYGSVALDG